MKILVGNNKLETIGGSETYTYAIVKELQRQGHEVEVVTTGAAGPAARAIANLHIPINFNHVEGEFDLALLSHHTSIRAATYVRAFKVQTCHGSHHHMEMPVKGMDHYVGVSEEVCNSLQVKGFYSTLINNGIDCERFKPITPLNERLTSVLSLCQNTEVNNELSILCKEMGLSFKSHINHDLKSRTWNVETAINNADLVFTVGRGAYESMACGRNVVLYDRRHYASNMPIGDGFVNKWNVKDFITYNCSGRFSKKEFNIKELMLEMLQYNTQTGEDLREYALENLNIETQVKKYLDLVK